jgi:ATP-dependent Clp protease ATP-binding subunit ClpX
MEGVMTDVMYSVPSDKSVEKVIITADSVKNGSSPMIVRKKQKEESVS